MAERFASPRPDLNIRNMFAPSVTRRRSACRSNPTAFARCFRRLRDAGALRIRDVSDRTQLPHQSINALMQYLKRKQLLTKVGPGAFAPYSLTEQGRAVLAQMTLREAA